MKRPTMTRLIAEQKAVAAAKVGLTKAIHLLSRSPIQEMREIQAFLSHQKRKKNCPLTAGKAVATVKTRIGRFLTTRHCKGC